MLEVYRDGRTSPQQERTAALKPELRSWTGRIWRATPESFQLMLKLDASVAVSEIGHADLRAALTPFAAELSSFALYLDHTHQNHLPGSFNVEHGNHTFMRFYDFLDTVPAHALIPLLPAAGAQSDLILSVIPYSLENESGDFRCHRVRSRLP